MTLTGQKAGCLSAPQWFLAGIDADSQCFYFLETSEERISELAFLDGRTPVSTTGRSQNVSVTEALAWQDGKNGPKPPSFILHTSFCGSTLLAGFLQQATDALVYREPDILVQLANLKATKHNLTQTPEIWRAIESFVAMQLSKSWHGAPVIVKPSNWANTLLADMSFPENKPVMVVTSAEEDFLIANLRGGKARLSYSLDLLNQYLTCGLANRSEVLAVERGGYTAIGRLLRLLCILYDSQRVLLDRTVASAMRISLSWLQSDPHTAVENAMRAFGLSIDQVRINQAIGDTGRRHAKSREKHFRLEEEKAENDRLYTEFEAEFDALHDWRNTEDCQTA